MANEQNYYEVTPRIVRAGSEVVITVRPLYEHVHFKTDQPYSVVLIPTEGISGQMRWSNLDSTSLVAESGELRVPCRFEGEQEYVLVVSRGEKIKVEFHLYALEEDLFDRRPYKGDFHMHTHHSDGIESPSYVAASCRKIGMDFMAITDHHQYKPSLEAIQAFSGVGTGLRIYPGEEVHAPGNPVHILNFGGSFSVNDLFRSDEYLSGVKEVENGLAGIAEDLDRYPYASCAWCCDQIRAGGGLAVFCHPYWFYHSRYDVPQSLTTLLFERQPYDALELIGGYHRFEVESNLLQVARYHDERARGKRIPIVGVSDAHGCETGSLFGWYYTIVFARSCNLPDLVQGIKDLYSVAVEALPGEIARAHGPFRLARFTQYLLREVFPLHDPLCQEEGRALLAYAAGDLQAAAGIPALAERVRQSIERCWA